MSEKVLILKNDRTGDLFVSLRAINKILNKHQNENIEIFLSKVNYKFKFLFPKIKKKVVSENLNLIDKKTSFERLEIIQNELFENQIQKNKSLENSIVEVLVENFTEDKTKTFGRSKHMTSVIFDGKKSDIGKIVQVKISKSNRSTLFGEIVDNSNQKVA